MTIAAYTLAVLLDLFCLFLGYRFWFQPAPAAAGYGVPADPAGDAGAYLSVKGGRDAAFGLVGLVLLALVGARAEAWFMVCVALVPLLDTVTVLRHGGTRAVAFGIHFATAVVVLICAALLFAA
ncbi:DUF4267 domain-containing protein [Streptomyces griseofuscus]|uniref:DUF4267 domain-containing protein n=1 Tax=Streptomyces griseofuscus TaxID=146922 RepID=A0A426S0X2_9ACTN|nr:MULTISPECIES: DUF4267 domain-containing protein [Streptomyces]BBC93508.1 DUF4267 domain-containing protein [Streptomyces rochei]MBA9048267.1 hypothetical protein [Streptomyces murinus]MBJ7003570.1 DUF4267 domain-containing protein [Streptomyces sp. CRPSP2-6A1]MYQ90154.1 DUF4267 domain-containing protein [Streptomyces sp. SID4946]QNT92862.1 small membrane hydrophobic protein [Streptomyces griseofuscus]